MEFSNEQQKAITETGQNILVSAGAGSGKTAVLTERIYQLIKKGCPISSFLVLTFSNAAAAEMKERIRNKLLKDPDPKFHEMAYQLDEAHIETFDAFFLYVAKRYHYLLNINKDLMIIDNSLIEIKKRKIIDEIIDELVQNNNQIFIDMVHHFSHQNDNIIISLIINLSKLASLEIDGNQFLDNYISSNYGPNRVNELIDEYFKKAKESLRTAIKLASQLEDLDDANNIIDSVNELLNSANYDELHNKLASYKFPIKSKNSCSNKEYREYIKNEYVYSLKNSKFGSSVDIKEIYDSNKEYAVLLVEIVKELDKRLEEYKRSINGYTFSDVARMALFILKNDAARKEISNGFEHILVDEYQDTSDIQEEAINLLGRNNIYMVGDVKQSIYRFRNANPKIFQDKYNDYKKNKGGLEIDLNASYRSREEVVNVVNEIFSKFMKPEYNAIDYSNGHTFIFGQKRYNQLNPINPQDYTLELYEYDSKKAQGIDDTIMEIELIADDIISKVNSGYQVYDKEIDDLRNCTFRDFAIIAQKGTQFEDYRRVFNEKGIPLYVRYNEKIRESDIILTLKSLAKVLYYSLNNNFNQDFVHAFLSVGRSFLFRKPDQELYETVKNKSYLNTDFMQKIELIQESLRFKSLYESLSTLYQEFNLYDRIITLGDFNENAHKADFFLNTAKTMDAMGFTLKDLVDYFDRLDEYDIEIEFSDSLNIENSVTILTIHKSKGLEYPICYFPVLSKQFNRDAFDGHCFITKEYGLILPRHIDNQNDSLAESLYKAKEIQADFEEKIRLYYVALTRAREKIILVSPVDDNEKPFNFTKANTFAKFNRFIKLRDTYGVLKEPVYEKLIVQAGNKTTTKTIAYDQIDMAYDVVESKRASKVAFDNVDEQRLLFGKKLHYYLEIVNYDIKDTSFIKNERERKIIDKVLNMNIFKGVKHDDIDHEYEYYDDINNVHGIIDCLITKDNEVDIIDFKLKKISDEAYDHQLHTYRDYIKTITSKEIKMYLLSIIDGDIREVK